MTWLHSLLSCLIIPLMFTAGFAADTPPTTGAQPPPPSVRPATPPSRRVRPSVETPRPSRPQQTLHVEVIFIDLTAIGEDGFKGLERTDLAGSLSDVLAKVKGLQKQGVVVNVKRLQVTALDGQLTRVNEGTSKPMVSGVTMRGGGFGGGPGGGPGGFGGGGPSPVTRSLTYHNVGTKLEVKPEIQADGTVALEMRIEDARLQTPADGIVLGTEDKETPIRATEITSLTVDSRLQVHPGKVALVQSARTSSKNKLTQALILAAVSLE